MNHNEKTLSVPEAGLIYFGLKSKSSSYRAASIGHIPTIRMGRRLRVPIKLMEEMLETATANLT